MQTLKQLGGGLGLGLVAAIVVLGGIILALAETGANKPVLVFPSETTAPIIVASLVPTSIEVALTPIPSGTPAPSTTNVVVLISSLTYTTIPCGAPATWVQYTVQSGDNLYQISLRYRLSVSELQSANCLGSSTLIYAGQKLWVPNVPTSTPPATILIDFPTATFTATNTSTPTATSTITSTSTPTSTATSTPTATSTATSTPPPAP